MKIVYVNAPLDEDEHEALAALAESEGRSKGQQLRQLALRELERMGVLPERKPITPADSASTEE